MAKTMTHRQRYWHKHVKADLEQSLLQVNEILHPYQFESYDDYKGMSDADMNRMLRIKMRMCKNLGNMIAEYSKAKSR